MRWSIYIIIIIYHQYKNHCYIIKWIHRQQYSTIASNLVGEEEVPKTLDSKLMHQHIEDFILHPFQQMIGEEQENQFGSNLLEKSKKQNQKLKLNPCLRHKYRDLERRWKYTKQKFSNQTTHLMDFLLEIDLHQANNTNSSWERQHYFRGILRKEQDSWKDLEIIKVLFICNLQVNITQELLHLLKNEDRFILTNSKYISKASTLYKLQT